MLRGQLGQAVERRFGMYGHLLHARGRVKVLMHRN